MFLIVRILFKWKQSYKEQINDQKGHIVYKSNLWEQPLKYHIKQ